MAFNIGNVQLTNTFDYWRQRTNDLINAMNSQVVAINANTATGNAVVNGTIQSVMLVANAIGGSATVGATGTIGAAANLTFTTNTVHLAPIFGTNTSVNGYLIATDANGTISANSTAIKLVTASGNTTITAPTSAQVAGGNYYLNANGSYTQVSVPVGVAGASSQVQFNDGGTLGASAGFTFLKSSNTVILANGSVSVGYSAANTTLTINGLQMNGTQVVNTTIYIGTSNNSTNFNGQAASFYASNTYLQSTLGSYATTSSLSSYATQTQMQANLANYVTTSSASSTYLTQSSASSTYLTQTSAASTYQTQSGMSSYLTTAAAASTYAPQASPTFSGPVFTSGRYYQGYVSLGTSSSLNLDLSQGHMFTGTASGATTATFSNPPPSGKAYGFTLVLQNGGNASFTWPAAIRWPSNTAPTLTSSGYDILAFFTYDGGTTWWGSLNRRAT